MPLYELVSARFRDSLLNGAFVADCSNLIGTEYDPELWLFGHTHDTIDTVLGTTRFVCNPAGYRHEYGTQYNRYKPTFIEV
jgi:hypothetical protein